MGIKLDKSTAQEAIAGLELGTLSNDAGKTGTYSFNYITQPSYLSINGNKLSLATNWFLDFETKKLLTLDIIHDKGQISQYKPQSLTFPTSIPIKFTPDSGSVVTDNVQVTISDQTETITVTPVKFKQNQYGVIVADIATNPNTSEAIYFEGPSPFEISGNKLKLKDDYFYSEAGAIIKWKGSGTYEQYPMTATNSSFNLKFISISKYEPADTNDYGKVLLTHDSYKNSIFGSSNAESDPVITLTPTQFYDKTVGSIIAKIIYSGSESVEFSLETDSVLEISGTNLKLKSDYYYDQNTGRITKKDFSGKELANVSDLHITATNKDNSKKISTEKIPISEITSTVFGTSNVLDKDESYTFVTDIKAVTATTPRNQEYQKLISEDHWQLKDTETISYSFLAPGASYDSTKSDIKEFSDLVAVTPAFKAAAKSAFDIISSYAKINFIEISETGDVTGDFRLGIAGKDGFAMDLKFGAYSQGITNLPTGGNIFFNGTVDKNGNGEVDYNEADQVKQGTWHFATFLHEIGHSLGLKHPFEDLSGGTSKTSEIFGDQFDQYRYTLMSYTPIIDQKTFADYEGVTLNQKYGSGPYYPDTLMLYDVMALQEMYGATSNSTGDDNYTFAADKPPFKAIYDTGGTDTLDLSKLTGGSTLDLSGNKISIIGSDYLRPWKNEAGKSTSTYGDYQGSSMSIISGTELEKVLLPDGASEIITGNSSTFIVGKTDAAITANIKSTQVAIKSSGTADDTITLTQTATKWGSDVQARNMGNAGKGATAAEITKMSEYLKHDISLDLKEGVDTLNATSGNDALFLQNFTTTGDALWYKDAGSSDSVARLLGLNKINLLEGNNFLDLTSTTTSLASEQIQITSGSGNDILWLSDADETIDTGGGDDHITLNGGSDNLKTGTGKDVITFSNYKGIVTIQDFDTSKDKFNFKASSTKVSANGNKITMENSLGNYEITLSNSPDLSDLSSFSTFA